MPSKTKKITNQDSYDWWLNRISQQQKKSFVAEDYLKMNRRKIGVGSLVSYTYTAKTPISALKFWDKHPLVLIFNDFNGYFMGLNLHYAVGPYRKTILAHVIKINKLQIKNDKRFKLAWDDLKMFIKRNGLEILIRKYIKARMSSVEYVKGEDWLYVSKLPSERFVYDGNFSADQLQQMIRSNSKSKKSKNKRFGR